jgi:hypothetical protein
MTDQHGGEFPDPLCPSAAHDGRSREAVSHLATGDGKFGRWHYKKYSDDENLAVDEIQAKERKLGLWFDA